MKKKFVIFICMSFILSINAQSYVDTQLSIAEKEIRNNNEYTAIRRLTRLINEGRDRKELYITRAKAYIQIKYYTLAIKDCDMVISVYPYCKEAYFIRGKCKYYNYDSSYVDDLKKGGYDGHRFLTEIGYYDKQTDKQNVRNNSYTKRKKKEIIEKRQLKKDPNFKLD